MTGRARGRGVARGRGTAQVQSAGPSRRPQSSAATEGRGTGEPSSTSENGSGGAAVGGAGRAAHRGGARGEARPGAAAVEMPTTQMAAMTVGTESVSERRKKRELSYHLPNTKPANLTDKKGTHGKPVNLVTNFYTLDSKPGWQIYHYYVEFNPPQDSTGLRKGLVGSQADKLFSIYLFDGMHLYTPSLLPEKVTELLATRNFDGTKVRIIIKRVAELPTSSPECIHILNIMMRQMLSDLGLKEVQGGYFSPEAARCLDRHKLEVWPGYKTSIQQYDEAVMLNVDLSHKLLRMDTVLDSMYEIWESCGRDKKRFLEICIKKLVGKIVMTRYNDKTYRIDDITDDGVCPTSTFMRKDKAITYMDYYKEVYGITVNDPNQPLLVTRLKKKEQRSSNTGPDVLYLIPELCTMTGLTDEMRANFNMMKDLAVHTRIDPHKRLGIMTTFRDQLQRNEKAQSRLQGWGVQLSANPVQLTARLLPPEQVALGGNRDGSHNKVSAGKDAEWNRDLRGKLYTTVALRSWYIIFARQNGNNAERFVNCLTNVAGPMGINVAAPEYIALPNQNTTEFLRAIKQHTNPSVQLIVCILPTNKKDLYDAIKKQCCLEQPVPSQCVTNNKINNPKGLMSIVSKIAIQINCKLGGEAWALEIPMKRLMVIGIDTYHDSAKKGRSVGGFVASLNSTLTRYYSQTTMQMNLQELIDTLKVTLTNALKKYHEINGCLPDRIIVFRDGVGDGQLPTVVEHEVKQLKQALLSLSEQKIKLSVVIVKKRISARFFGKTERGLTNPGPGTVIDNTATRPESYDYYIVSQSVRQGTVAPTNYNVVWDESGLLPDHMQRLTYKLCHLYYNWPGTIRVPAPCQYAHKLAFLTGQSLHKQHHMSLADKLFYL